MPKSADEIREELRLKSLARKQASPKGVSQLKKTSDNGEGPSSHLRQRAEPKSAGMSQPFVSQTRDVYREPPHSIEAEQALLSSMMADKGVVIPEITRRISAEHFYVPSHRTLFQAILDNFEQVEAINFSTVTQHLMRAGLIDSVGGVGYVTDIGPMVPTSANYEFYLETVETDYARRWLIADSTTIARQACEPGADIATLAEHVQALVSRFSALAVPQKSGLTVRTPNELIGMMFDESDNYFGDRILAAGQPCTLIGPGGVGKSRLSLQLGVCATAERDFFGMPTRAKGKKWLFIQTENSNRRLHYDLKSMISALELTSDEIANLDQLLFIHTLENDSDCFLNLLNPRNYAAVNRLVQEIQPDFVAWDPLNSFTDNDLNSDADMRALVCAISGVTRAGNPNRVPLVLHHSLTGKIGAARAVGWDKASYGRNSKVLQAWTRAQINLAPRSADDPNLLIMSCGKNNNGRHFPEVGLRFDEHLGMYVKDDSFDPDKFRQEVGIGGAKHKGVTPEDAAALCEDGIAKPKLAERIMEEFGIQQRAAYDAINRTEDAGLIKKNKGHWPSTYSQVWQERRSYDEDQT